jgi:putative ABC transport system permease protein
VKFLPIIWSAMWRRRARSVLTLLSIVNAFALFGLLQGFTSGLGHVAADSKADILFTLSRLSRAEPLPVAQIQMIRKTPGVQAASPLVVVLATYRSPRELVPTFAVDTDAIARTYPALGISPAQTAALARVRSGALVEARLAQRYGWQVGDRVPLNALQLTNKDGSRVWPVDVVGIYSVAGDEEVSFAAHAILVNFDYIDQGRLRGTGTANMFLLRVTDPRQADSVASVIDQQFVNSPYETKTVNQRQMAQVALKQIGDVGFATRAIVGAMFFALLFSVGSVLVQAVRERSPELAVLKTIGFTDTQILLLIFGEALVFWLGASAIGLVVAVVFFPLIKAKFGLDMQAGLIMVWGLGIAALLAMATGLPPALLGMRLRVVDALARG